MSLQEWLVLLGGIVIVVVLLDGCRRMRLARKRSSELSFGLEEVKGQDDSFGSELPNGGARKVADELGLSASALETPEITKRSKKHFRTDHGSTRDRNQARAERERIEPEISGMDFNEPGDAASSDSLVDPQPEQATLDFHEAVPVLMNVDEAQNIVDEPSADIPGPGQQQELSPTLLGEEQVDRVSVDFAEPSQEVEEPQNFADSSDGNMVNDQVPRTERNRPSKQEKLADRPPAKEVLVINVLARDSRIFDGARLLQSLLNTGMRYGDMSIFHQYSNKDGTGQILFSLANGVEPGTFDIENIEAIETSAVSFFMGLPGPGEPMKAF